MFMDEFHMWNAPTELQETNMFVHFFQILNFKKYNVLNLLLKNKTERRKQTITGCVRIGSCYFVNEL